MDYAVFTPEEEIIDPQLEFFAPRQVFVNVTRLPFLSRIAT
jgi:hypothetical protein